MIGNITGAGAIQVGQYGNHRPYLTNAGTMSGTMRYHNGQVEAFDGMTWHRLETEISITLNATSQAAIDWAIKKMFQEKEIERLAAEHRSVKVALDHLKQAQSQLDVTVMLVRDYDQPTD